MPASRRALLRAAMGFSLVDLDAPPPVLRSLRAWLSSWAGIGAIIDGMERQSYDIDLTRYNEHGWRATFFRTGRVHSLTRDSGSAWEPTAAEAVQRAAWEALAR